MSVNAEQVRHVAKLARIAMSDAEVDALVPELNNILGWVEQLAAVDTEGVEPLTAVIDQKLRLRDDVVNDGNVRDKVLLNAPDAQHGFFAVPKVIEYWPNLPPRRSPSFATASARASSRRGRLRSSTTRRLRLRAF